MSLSKTFLSEQAWKLLFGKTYCSPDLRRYIYSYLSKCSFKKMSAIVKIQRWYKKYNESNSFYHNIVSIFGKKLYIKIRQTETIKSIKRKLFLMNFFEKPDITIDNYSDKIRIIICGMVISDDIVLWKAHESYYLDKILNLRCIHAIYVRN